MPSGLDIGTLLTAGGTAATSALSPWTLAAAAPAELFKLGKGFADRALAAKLDRSTQRPGFEIPAAAIEALGTQRNLAMGRAPGITQAQSLMLQGQAENTNAILNSGGGAGERMAALLGQSQLANQGALQLGATQENWAAQQNQNLINQLNRFEDWQARKWQWDRQQPYEQAKAKAAELRGDANQNIYGALRGLGGQAASVIGYGNDENDASNAKAASGIAGSGLSGALGAAMKKAADPSKTQGISPRTPSVMTEPSWNYSAPEGTLPFRGLRNKVKFNPDEGNQEYDFNAIQDEYARKGIQFNPDQGMESYDFEDAVKPPFPKGPYPLGYDPKTMKITPFTGPPNYSPAPEAPNGPFPASQRGGSAGFRSMYPFFRGLTRYLGGIR